MNKWYEINVKEQVLKELQKYVRDSSIELDVINVYQSIGTEHSVRDLLCHIKDNYLELNIEQSVAIQLFNYGLDQFLNYRRLKYGQIEFWDCAKLERDIVYENKWQSFLMNLINKHERHPNLPILFLGCSDGSEIPYMNREVYAIDHLDTSIARLKENRSEVKAICADFEDMPFLQTRFSTIIGLRCIMPNTRLDVLFQNLNQYLLPDSIIIFSHPLAHLNEDYEFISNESNHVLLNLSSQFEQLIQNEHLELVNSFSNQLEHFWILKKMGSDLYEAH
jgi:SAM-dependent methyltransferase